MRPRTSLEKEVVALSATLPDITAKEIDEAMKSHCHIYHSSASSWCEHCGHVWKQYVNGKRKKWYECPHCGTRLYMRGVHRKHIEHSSFYFALIRVCVDFQVIRTFMCNRSSRRNVGIINWECNEVFQVWMKPGFMNVYMAKAVNGMSMYVDSWKIGSPMVLRPYHRRYELEGYLSKRV